MCWSGEASLVAGSVGMGFSLYSAYKKEPISLWGTLGYFSLMELLQGYTYSVIDNHLLLSNQIATLLGFLHIAFQPFFANALSMYFIPSGVRQKIAPWVYTFCFITTIILLIKMYPFPSATMCTVGSVLCGENLGSVSGSWHIAWELPLNGLMLLDYGFLEIGLAPLLFTMAMFGLPLLYGSWRFTLYHALFGPFLAFLTTSNPNEWPAVWCLLSIAFLLIVAKTPVRRIMHVKNWFLWKKLIA